MTDKMLWKPTDIEKTQLWQFMQYLQEQGQGSFEDYQALYRFSIDKPSEFWGALSRFFKVHFHTEAQEILSPYQDMLEARWFQGAQLNFAENLLKRKDQHPALLSIDELGRREVITFAELHEAVAACAAGLIKAGVKPQDRVAGIMPNTAWTIIAMLATSAIGAIWSSCSPDFGLAAILDRLGQIEPKVVFICDGHSYQGKSHSAADKIKSLLDHIPSIETLVICPNLVQAPELQPHAKIQHLSEFLIANQPLTFYPTPFSHPLYILFSSGTTGQPKCIVHSVGGTLLQHLKELGLHCDINAQDKMLFYTTCGWMMWNWMASSLALGATLCLYEGSPTYPSSAHLFEILDKEGVTVFGTSAKFIATLEKANLTPNQNHPLDQLRLILSTGSPLVPHHFDYIQDKIKSGIEIASMSGGTDIISCFALANPIVPVYSGELQSIGLGMAVAIFNDQGQAVFQEQGELVCTQAFPSMPIGFWKDENKQLYRQTYFEKFPGVWTHGDFAEITIHQGLIISGRSDSTLKPGGVRIGTAEIYRQIDGIAEILEAVVVGQKYQDDVRVVLFVKLAAGAQLDENLKTLIRKKIKEGASPRHVPDIILTVEDIPHTLNGKLVEMAVSQVVNGLPVKNKDALANPESLDYFKDRPELKS